MSRYRITIDLSERLYNVIGAAALRRNTTRAEVILQALNTLFEEKPPSAADDNTPQAVTDGANDGQ